MRTARIFRYHRNMRERKISLFVCMCINNVFCMYVYTDIRVYTFIRKLFLYTHTVQFVNNNIFIRINMNLCTNLLYAFAKICIHICARKKTNTDWIYVRLLTQVILVFARSVYCNYQLTISFNVTIQIKKGGKLAAYAEKNKIMDPAGPWNLVAICDAPKVFEILNFFHDLIFWQTCVQTYIYRHVCICKYLYIFLVNFLLKWFFENPHTETCAYT